MKILNFKTILIVATIFCLSVLQGFSQPRDFEKMKQRIITMKKISILEVLNLSEEKSDKFLAKYSSSENKIIDISTKIDESTQELHKLLEGKTAKVSDLKQKSDAIVKLQEELSVAMSDKFKSVQTVLNEEEFAKYLVFERNFQEKLRKHIMKRPRMGNPDDEEDDFPGPPPQRRRNR